LSRASLRGQFRPRGGIGEKIELMSGHPTMIAAAQKATNRAISEVRGNR
jgi:hypothetical protein